MTVRIPLCSGETCSSNVRLMLHTAQQRVLSRTCLLSEEDFRLAQCCHPNDYALVVFHPYACRVCHREKVKVVRTLLVRLTTHP